MTYGCDSLDVSRAFWGKWRAWMTDLDRGVDNQRLKAIIDTGVIKKDKLLDTFLESSVKKLSKTTDSSIWPWVLSIGSRNRMRTGGIQFCPICLNEKPYFRLKWRYAWHTCCQEHEIRLLQNCPICLNSIEYHRLTAEDKHLFLCATCKFDLRKIQTKPVESNEVAIQNVSDSVLARGYGIYGSIKLETPDWFSVNRFYIRLLQKCTDKRLKSLRKLADNLGINEIYQSSTGLSFEMLNVEDRALMLKQSHPLMVIGPKKFKQQLKACGVSLESCISVMKPLPEKIRNMFILDEKEKSYKTGERAKYLPKNKVSVLKAAQRFKRGIRKSD